MAGQTLITRELPTAVGHEMDGQDHLHDMAERTEVVVGLVEEAMPQTGTRQDTHKTVEEEGVEQFVLDLLLFV